MNNQLKNLIKFKIIEKPDLGFNFTDTVLIGRLNIEGQYRISGLLLKNMSSDMKIETNKFAKLHILNTIYNSIQNQQEVAQEFHSFKIQCIEHFKTGNISALLDSIDKLEDNIILSSSLLEDIPNETDA